MELMAAAFTKIAASSAAASGAAAAGHSLGGALAASAGAQYYAAASAAAVAGTVKTLGTILQAGGMGVDAINAKRGADFEAKQMEVQAGQERAASQRRAREERRQTQLMQSRAQAVSAASGGGAVDPTVVDIIGDIEEDGEYRALNTLWEGEERAGNLMTGAKQRRKQGRFALTSGLMGSAGTILDGSSSMFKRFGRK